MKGSPMQRNFGIGSPVKNYKNPQDYKVFNMGNEPTPIKQTDKDLKDYLLDEKGFNQADADRMIQDGAYTVSDKGFLAWYKQKDVPAEPKRGEEDTMEEDTMEEDVVEEGRI